MKTRHLKQTRRFRFVRRYWCKHWTPANRDLGACLIVEKTFAGRRLAFAFAVRDFVRKLARVAQIYAENCRNHYD